MNALENKRILIIGFVWPEPKSSAAGSRMMQLIAFFKENGGKITFASTASESEFSEELIDVDKKQIALNCTSFDEFVSELQPDLVLFDRFMTEEQFGWRVAEHCPNALRMLDSEDLHCLREARRLTVLKNKPFVLNNDLAKREIASIYRCDVTLMVSEFEMELLQTHFKVPSLLLFYLPIWVEKETLNLPSFEERSDFMFIGNFLHAPNHDAVVYLKEVIWPLLFEKFPEAKMTIYGAYPTQKINSLHQPKMNFFVHGRAESSFEVISKARVLLAPIRFGAGIKGKLLEAMEFGTPSVTSSIGAEAMNGDFLWNGFITDLPEDFAEKAIELYRNKSTWSNAQQNGFEILKNRFSKDLFEDSFKEFLSDKFKNLEKYRNENFTGLLLMHHFLQSTKYMAKWIEEKNKE
ncbi:glycosyltransferase family 4 protein [Flavobacterium azooxidireducens]|uniref:Glycosyltransferase family 4 protein n=1 Tax=Flavobacterium azooxidireducens TaxID=1871076 RepID=A0ABY4KK76_9FLAO|nr:glycosyltransferase family 4 protein [Flavobacterium azooxidireducens]UPQ79807.1 glycosyltransferase family 4 protein [Flavobacterium azooxidireducens]